MKRDGRPLAFGQCLADNYIGLFRRAMRYIMRRLGLRNQSECSPMSSTSTWPRAEERQHLLARYPVGPRRTGACRRAVSGFFNPDFR